MDLNTFLSAAVAGVGLGSMYGLTALGFFVTYAVSGTVNFAQGSTLMLGAVLAFTFGVKLGWPLWIAAPLSLAICAAWSALVEAVGVRPFARRGSESWLLATVASNHDSEPRRAKGRTPMASTSALHAAQIASERGPATHSGQPSFTPNVNAITAPSMSVEPCAKFTVPDTA